MPAQKRSKIFGALGTNWRIKQLRYKRSPRFIYIKKRLVNKIGGATVPRICKKTYLSKTFGFDTFLSILIGPTVIWNWRIVRRRGFTTMFCFLSGFVLFIIVNIGVPPSVQYDVLYGLKSKLMARKWSAANIIDRFSIDSSVNDTYYYYSTTLLQF